MLSESQRAFVDGRADLSDLPSEVSIEIVLGCNLRCRMCPVSSASQAMDGRKPVIMSLDLFRGILDQISSRPRHLLLTIYGEPLLHPQLPELVRLAKSHGHRVALITNGTKLNADVSLELIRSGLDTLSVSVDGFRRETYESIRLGASQPVVVENLMRFSELKAKSGSKVRLEINFVVSEKTRAEQGDFYRAFGPHVDHISFNPLNDFRGLLEMPQDLAGRTEPRPAGAAKRFPCIFLWTNLFISAEGRIMLCCEDLKLESGLPHVDEGILTVWQRNIGSYRRRHVGRHFDYEPCRSCRQWTADERVRAKRGTWKALAWNIKANIPRALSLMDNSSLASRLFLALDKKPAPFGSLDAPEPESVVQGPLDVMGWALARGRREIARVEIWLDGARRGHAVRGFYRPDVAFAFRGFRDSLLPGFRYRIDADGLPAGRHILRAVAIDTEGRFASFGERAFFTAPSV